MCPCGARGGRPMKTWWAARALGMVVAVGVGPAAGPAYAEMNMNNGTTCAPGGTSLSLVARGHTYNKDCLAVPADQPFTITFDNQDHDRHNVVILPTYNSSETFFRGEIIEGPATVTYSVQALKPGTFRFHCEVHPNVMNGTFIVAAGRAP